MAGGWSRCDRAVYWRPNKRLFIVRSGAIISTAPASNYSMTSKGKAKAILPSTRGRITRASTGSTAPRKKLATASARPPRPSTPPAPPPVNGGETDPNLITRPDPKHVHRSLTKTWAILPHRQMCIRFDVVNPLTQFKRGTSGEGRFPPYDPNPEEDPNVTENDEDGILREYAPMLLPECVSVS